MSVVGAQIIIESVIEMVIGIRIGILIATATAKSEIDTGRSSADMIAHARTLAVILTGMDEAEVATESEIDTMTTGSDH